MGAVGSLLPGPVGDRSPRPTITIPDDDNCPPTVPSPHGDDASASAGGLAVPVVPVARPPCPLCQHRRVT